MSYDEREIGQWHAMLNACRVDQLCRLEILASSDAFIVNSLLRCGISYPIIFSLVWGDTIVEIAEFPSELRKIVTGIIREEKKGREFLDPQEKKLHFIIIELLQVMYEKQVNDIIVKITEEQPK